MALVKMGQPGSSLSRSPTIKSGVDSLTCLSSLTITDDTRRERLNESRTLEIMPPRRNEISRYNQQRLFEIQLLLPPATLIIILIFWWYTKAHSNGHWNTASKTSLPSWIDFFAALLFFAALIQCVRLAFSHLTLRSQESALILLRASLLHNGGCLSIAWPKHISSILTDQSVTANKLTSPSVIWTIGSKSKCERSNLCGERVLRYANDDIYEGEIYEGSCSGSGVHYFCSSGKYEGDWVDGKYNGYGIETWAPGSRYKGQFQQGLRNGYGVYRFQTGDEYSGEWLHGQSHGYGVQTCNDGSRYIGEFKRGMKHGIGYYRFRNGDTYAGEYFEDKMHGYGVYRFGSLGHAYEGSWHEGARQGLGVYTFRNGETNAGQWNSDALIFSNPSPGSPLEASQTKLRHAVQEARRASLKALRLHHVGDQVKKAVTAADRAATAARNAAIKAKRRSSHLFMPSQ